MRFVRRVRAFSTAYVPKSREVTNADGEQLVRFFERNPAGVTCLTGAGISTESGIPDYRSKGVGLYDRKNHKPILHQEFLKSKSHRQRYWARNYVGYQYFSVRQPNENHHRISDLVRSSRIANLITQNVDGLHIKAGSTQLTELHGNSHRAFCLDCKHIISRAKLQDMLRNQNQHWHRPEDLITSSDMAPDSDAVLTADVISGFEMCSCPRCGGVLKPDVVFFGDNVNYTLVKDCYNQVANSSALLVIGTSLEVWSGFRFCREAFTLDKDVMIINIGETRADRFVEKNKEKKIFNFEHLHVQSSDVLAHACRRLGV